MLTRAEAQETYGADYGKVVARWQEHDPVFEAGIGWLIGKRAACYSLGG